MNELVILSAERRKRSSHDSLPSALFILLRTLFMYIYCIRELPHPGVRLGLAKSDTQSGNQRSYCTEYLGCQGVSHITRELPWGLPWEQKNCMGNTRCGANEPIGRYQVPSSNFELPSSYERLVCPDNNCGVGSRAGLICMSIRTRVHRVGAVGQTLTSVTFWLRSAVFKNPWLESMPRNITSEEPEVVTAQNPRHTGSHPLISSERISKH